MHYKRHSVKDGYLKSLYIYLHMKWMLVKDEDKTWLLNFGNSCEIVKTVLGRAQQIQ